MDLRSFTEAAPGTLVPIHGTSTRWGPWEHQAFVPDPLPPGTPPSLNATAFTAVADARAAIASLGASARRLPDPSLLRRPTLRREAQSTSALEGTYAPLESVLAAGVDEDQDDAAVREVLNYVRMAEHAFAWHADGRPMTLGLLTELHAILVRGTPADGDQAGQVRTIQVAIGGHPGGRVQDARFVPRPPGPELTQQVRDWLAWIEAAPAHGIDPVVAAALGHYHVETLHPFNDGNGRIGRLFVVLQLLYSGALTEPSLTVSPWFEARRAAYYDALMGVSTHGDWNTWVHFFAAGLAASARDTEQRLLDLLDVQNELKEQVRASNLRAESAMLAVDFALSRPIFTVSELQVSLDITYARTNRLVRQLAEIGVLRQFGDNSYSREFAAPDVLAVLLRP